MEKIFSIQCWFIIIIENKSDLIKEIGRIVKIDSAKSYAEKDGSIHIETSAKTGENIEDSFKELANRMISFIKEKIIVSIFIGNIENKDSII